MNMAEKIRQCRRKIDLTQPELADLVGVSPMTVRRWEWNERTPNASLIPKLAEALNTTAGYLLGETEAPGENENQKSEHIYKKEVEEKKEAEDFSYWGGVVNNARRVAEHGDAKEIALVGMLLRTATDAIMNKIPEEKISQAPAVQIEHNRMGDMNF